MTDIRDIYKSMLDGWKWECRHKEVTPSEWSDMEEWSEWKPFRLGEEFHFDTDTWQYRKVVYCVIEHIPTKAVHIIRDSDRYKYNDEEWRVINNSEKSKTDCDLWITENIKQSWLDEYCAKARLYSREKTETIIQKSVTDFLIAFVDKLDYAFANYTINDKIISVVKKVAQDMGIELVITHGLEND